MRLNKDATAVELTRRISKDSLSQKKRNPDFHKICSAMAIATVHADRLFFAMGQMGPVHDRFTVRVCVDEYIDFLQFGNSGIPGDIRVSTQGFCCYVASDHR